MSLKITPADSWFSKCVRERAGWRCERCGSQPSDPRGLHCSHIVGRGNWATRLEPLNADALCYGCHAYFEANPHEFDRWVRSRLNGTYDLLIELSNDRTRGKEYKRTAGKGEVAAHYKQEYERLLKLRSEGRTERLEFSGWL